MRQSSLHRPLRLTPPDRRAGPRTTALFRAGDAQDVVEELRKALGPAVLWLGGASGVGKTSFIEGAVLPAWKSATRGETPRSMVLRLVVQPGESLREFHQRSVMTVMERVLPPHHPAFEPLREQALFDPASAGQRLVGTMRRVQSDPMPWLLWTDELDRLFVHRAGLGGPSRGFQQQLVEWANFIEDVAAQDRSASALVSYRNWIQQDLERTLGARFSTHSLDGIDPRALAPASSVRSLIQQYASGREWNLEAVRWVAREFSAAPQAIALARPYLRSIRSTASDLPHDQPIKGIHVREVGGLRGFVTTRAERIYHELETKDPSRPWKALIQRFANPHLPGRPLDSICLGNVPRGQGEWRLAMELVDRRVFRLSGHRTETTRLAPVLPSLLQDWARASRWLETGEAIIEAEAEQFEHHARSWVHSKRDAALLLQAPESVERAIRVLEENDGTRRFSSDTREFLVASIEGAQQRGQKTVPIRAAWIGSFVTLIVLALAIAVLRARPIESTPIEADTPSAPPAQSAPEKRVPESENGHPFPLR